MDKLTITEDTFISTELKKFEIDEAGLISTAGKYKNLKIEDVNDKVGLSAVRTARLELKDIRVDISKKAKKIRESAVRFQKAVIAREAELIELVEPTERLLEAEEDRIMLEKKRIREEEEKREFERLQSMMDKLAKVNYAVDFTELKGFTDDQFATVLQEATTKYEEFEISRKAEEQRQKEEVERMAAERKAEEDRLKKVAAEQEARNREFEAKEAELRKAQDELNIAQAKVNQAIREAEDRKNKEEAEKKLFFDLEQARKEAAEKAIKDKEEADRLAKEELAREEAEKPDKEKVIKFAHYLLEEIEYPVCSTEKGQQIIAAIKVKVQEMATSLHATAKRRRW